MRDRRLQVKVHVLFPTLFFLDFNIPALKELSVALIFALFLFNDRVDLLFLLDLALDESICLLVQVVSIEVFIVADGALVQIIIARVGVDFVVGLVFFVPCQLLIYPA